MTKPILVLVLAESAEVAREWIDSQPKVKGILYTYAHRWSAFLGRSTEATFFYCAGEWWRVEEADKAMWWGKDHGFREWNPHKEKQ